MKCVGREEFDSLQMELNYYQNTTINILKKYLIDSQGEIICMYINIVRMMSMHNSGSGPNDCSVKEDHYLEDRVEERDKMTEGILNQTRSNLLLFASH